MSVKVAFVAQVGRISVGNMTALPKVEQIAAANGGKYVGGVGSSTDPMICEFAALENASKAASEAWYLDDIEFAKVLNTDGPGPADTVKVNESEEEAAPVIESIEDAIDAVVEGASADEVAESLVG